MIALLLKYVYCILLIWQIENGDDDDEDDFDLKQIRQVNKTAGLLWQVGTLASQVNSEHEHT